MRRALRFIRLSKKALFQYSGRWVDSNLHEYAFRPHSGKESRYSFRLHVRTSESDRVPGDIDLLRWVQVADALHFLEPLICG